MSNKYDGLEIAIIGMAAKFPGSKDFRSYWENLRDGKELIKQFTEEELIQWGVPKSHLKDKSYVKSFGILEDKDCFDHHFFGYTPDEASLMDPQIRLLHECCWSALEDAGYSSMVEKQKISLFAGASRNYNWKAYSFQKTGDSTLDPFYKDMITSNSFISTLVAYKLNLRGNSYYVDTACSTSLSAIHLACRSLLFGDSKIALAGAASLFSHKPKGYFHSDGMIYSSDGHCRAFDKDSDGTVGSEGVGVVVLKKLSEAIKDRDNIYCIIRASAANNDGNQKVGYTAPSVKGQAECIKMAHKMANIAPTTISYIEAHGTGTKLGDPVEVRALNEAFGSDGSIKYCAVGSVKSNIGHADTAAGVAGLIKVALSLKYRQIPPSIHYSEPNPEIDFKGGPFFVNAKLTEWVSKEGAPLRAGVSSFGIGGTNVHAILEEAPSPTKGNSGRDCKLLTLSAKCQEALSRYIDVLKEFLVKEKSSDLADLAYTYQIGRKHFEYRKSIVFSDRDDLLGILGDTSSSKLTKAEGKHKQIIFMFSGAGSQYPNMGKDLYLKEPVFKKEMDIGFAHLKELTGLDYQHIIYPSSSEDNSINIMLHTQPLIFVFGYSLARLLMSWGVQPSFMIGHSIGEYVAACLSGVFKFEDALKLVVTRGQLMNDMPHGSMVSASMSEEKARQFINDKITIAAINGSEQIVFSGDLGSIKELMEELDRNDISYLKLYASHAGHSAMIDDIIPAYQKVLATIHKSAPTIPFVSNLTGDIITTQEATSDEYWIRHMRETVLFSRGVKTLISSKKDIVFVEVGGSHALTSLVKQHQTEDFSPIAFNLIRHPKEQIDDQKYLTEILGKLWEHGININWHAYYAGELRSRASIPTYPFETSRFPAMVDPVINGLAQSFQASAESLKDWIYYPVWKTSVPMQVEVEYSEKWYLHFSQDNTLSSAISSTICENSSSKIIEVIKGREYGKLDKNKYIVNPTVESHFDALFADLASNNIDVHEVIYSWGMDADFEVLALAAGNESLLNLYFCLAIIVKRLALTKSSAARKIFVITDSLHKVVGNEKVNFWQSLLLGLVNTIPQEYPIDCCNIDINSSEDLRKVAASLVRQVQVYSGKERHIAIRYGQKWIKDFEKNTRSLIRSEQKIRMGGTYLVTGGLGNVGFILSEYLLRTYDVQLAILGRRKINAEENIGESALRLTHLKNINGRVAYYNCDVADSDAFSKTVSAIRTDFGTIHGVIHAAGNVNLDSFELVEDISLPGVCNMLAPKMHGIYNIYKVFKDSHPDFVWITSSLASVLSGVSFSTYSSANLFMDYFISSISADLPSWKCVGLSEMIFDGSSTDDDTTPKKGLSPEEIIDLFEWSVSLKDTPLILETIENLPARIDRVYSKRKMTSGKATHNENGIKQLERSNISTLYSAPVTETEKRLASMVEEFFGIAGIGMEDNFFELGGDSLKAMVLLKRIKKEFDINIPIKSFFSYANLREVATEVETRLWLNKPSEKKFVSII